MLLGGAGVVVGLAMALIPLAALYRETLDAPLDSQATGEGVAASMWPGVALGISGSVTYVAGAALRRFARVRRR